MSFKRLRMICIVTLAGCFFAISSTMADEGATSRKVGISAYLQSSQFDIAVPIWAGDRVVIEPFIGIATIGGVASDVRLGFMFRINLRTGTAVPYVGARAGILTESPKVGNSSQDVILGPALGGEYFLDRHFSFGVEAQINVAISADESSRFGNPGGTNVNTSTAALMTFYF